MVSAMWMSRRWGNTWAFWTAFARSCVGTDVSMYVCMYAQDVYSCAVLTSTATRLSLDIADAVVQKKILVFIRLSPMAYRYDQWSIPRKPTNEWSRIDLFPQLLTCRQTDPSTVLDCLLLTLAANLVKYNVCIVVPPAGQPCIVQVCRGYYWVVISPVFSTSTTYMT